MHVSNESHRVLGARNRGGGGRTNMQALSPVGITEFDFSAGMIIVVVVVERFAKKILLSRKSAGALLEDP